MYIYSNHAPVPSFCMCTTFKKCFVSRKRLNLIICIHARGYRRGLGVGNLLPSKFKFLKFTKQIYQK